MRLLAVSLSLLFVPALASCVRTNGIPNANSDQPSGTHASEPARRKCVNLNSATAEELQLLPGIGEVTARKLVEYREQNGPYRRPEEIIIIEGFSERKYRAIADLICVE